jgi:hypothetical protein
MRKNRCTTANRVSNTDFIFFFCTSFTTAVVLEKTSQQENRHEEENVDWAEPQKGQ